MLLAVLLMTVPLAHARLDAGPVNLYAGVAMLVFGAVMLALGWRAGHR